MRTTGWWMLVTCVAIASSSGPGAAYAQDRDNCVPQIESVDPNTQTNQRSNFLGTCFPVDNEVNVWLFGCSEGGGNPDEVVSGPMTVTAQDVFQLPGAIAGTLPPGCLAHGNRARLVAELGGVVFAQSDCFFHCSE